MTEQNKTWDKNLNTAIWDSAYVTDRKYTKDFTRGGGFRGTAISPMYIVRKATEIFGPCGIRWGFQDVGHTVEDTGNGKIWFSLVRLWYLHPETGEYGQLEQWGGTPLVTSGKTPMADDEAAKKAVTDGLTKCLTYLGFGADVHLNDTSKYAEHEGGYSPTPDTANSPTVSKKAAAKQAVEKHNSFPAAMKKIQETTSTVELGKLMAYINGFGFNDADLAELTATAQAKSRELSEATSESNTNA